MRMAKIQKANLRIRSMTAPETIEAEVQAKSRKAAQKTPLMRSSRRGPMLSPQGV